MGLNSVLITLSLVAQLTTEPTPSEARIETAQVFFIDDVEVPAQETGLLMRVYAREGDLVEEGQPLVHLDDRKPQLTMQVADLERAAALARAEDEIEVEYALATLELAETELAKDQEINKRSPGSVPESDIRHKRLAVHRARLQIDRSRLDKHLAEVQAEVQSAAVMAAEETMRRCQIVAPFDGMIVDVLRQESEWVNAGEPVLRIARLNRLRVDGLLNAAEFNAQEVADRPVTVEVRLARGRRVQFQGQVVFVSPLVQAGNKYRIRAEVDNRLDGGHWILRPGLPTAMTIHVASSPAAASPTADRSDRLCRSRDDSPLAPIRVENEIAISNTNCE
jgi:RND family efflux transporter MFP subunit